jgi:DNA-binding transcriptional LysR family regulator
LFLITMIASGYAPLMRGVELRHLATLAAIAEEQTFRRAAARLGYTQSTVSQHIAALERAVGGPLFDRPGGPRPVRITALGSVVLAQGRDLLADAERLTEAVDRFKAGDGRVDIGTFQSVSNVILPALVRRLRDEHPGCDIRLSEEEADDPDIGDLDLLFYDGRVGGEVESRLLLDDPYLLVARPGDFPDGPARVRDLDGVPWVAWPATCDQPRMEQALTDSGVRPRIVFRTAGNETILSMVRAGLGVALLPWLAVHGADVWSDDRLRIHQLRPAIAREVYVHWPARRTQSPLAARAVEIAGEIADELSAQRDRTV